MQFTFFEIRSKFVVPKTILIFQFFSADTPQPLIDDDDDSNNSLVTFIFKAQIEGDSSKLKKRTPKAHRCLYCG